MREPTQEEIREALCICTKGDNWRLFSNPECSKVYLWGIVRRYWDLPFTPDPALNEFVKKYNEAVAKMNDLEHINERIVRTIYFMVNPEATELDYLIYKTARQK